MPKSYLNMPGYPLGLRNNNPGNIRPFDPWKGMIGTNSGFAVFEHIPWGLRAMAIDLTTKITNGYDTIEKILYRYAPPSENDTEAYINSVINYTNFSRWQPLPADQTTIRKLMKGMIRVENGTSFGALITDADITEAFDLMDNPLPVGVAVAGAGIAIALFLLSLYLLATMPKAK